MLALSPEEAAAFRDEARAFIADNHPAKMRMPNPETDLTEELMLPWHRILHKKNRTVLAEGIWRGFIFEQPAPARRRPWRSASPWSVPSRSRLGGKHDIT